MYHFNSPDLILIGLILKLIGKKVIYDVYENVCLDELSKEWIFLQIRKVKRPIFGRKSRVANKLKTASI